MAVVTVRIARGPGVETKRKLARAVTQALCDALDMPHSEVTVLIEEYAPENWSDGGELRADRGKVEATAYDLEALFRKPVEKSVEKKTAPEKKPAAKPTPKASPRKAAAKSRSRR